LKWYKVFVDMDGTIAGESEWKGFWWNTRKLFSELKWKPPDYVQWSILTARPRIDRYFMNKVCKKYGLMPEEIITSPTWWYYFADSQEVSSWKASVLMKYLQQPLVNKVIYIDDDPNILQHITITSGLYVCNTLAAGEYFKEIIKGVN